MASEDVSLSKNRFCCEMRCVLNAGWRLRMFHKPGGAIHDWYLEVLNAGWRLRMFHVTNSNSTLAR